MIGWLRQKTQTRTPVHDKQESQREKETGLSLARHTLMAILLLSQLLIWVSAWGYDGARQTTWQSAVMLALPLGALCLLWKQAESAALSRAGVYIALPLVLCLMGDHYVMLTASSSLMNTMIPSFPNWGKVLVVAVFPLLTVWRCGEKGLNYGAYALRNILLVLFAFSTVLIFAQLRLDRLWPLMGKGIGNTALTAVGGIGAVWGVALFHLFPSKVKAGKLRPGRPLFIWLPMALCVLWALWMGMISPWRVGETLPVGEKLIGMSQYSASIIIAEIGALFWMLLLPVGLGGVLMLSGLLLQRAFPRLDRRLALLLSAAPGIVGLAFSPAAMLPFAAAVLPWRYALSAAVGIGLVIAGGRGKKR